MAVGGQQSAVSVICNPKAENKVIASAGTLW